MMTKNGQDLYFDEPFMTQPNHERVARMLHEMQLVPHVNHRQVAIDHQQELRDNSPSLLDWYDSPKAH